MSDPIGMPVCEACGEPATRQDCEGVWLCEGDYRHLVEHSLIEDAADCGAPAKTR